MVVDGVTAFALIHDGGGSDGAVAISPIGSASIAATAPDASTASTASTATAPDAATACDPHVPVTGPNTQLIVLSGVNCPIT